MKMLMQVSAVYELPLTMVGEREACLGAALAIFDRCFFADGDGDGDGDGWNERSMS